MSHDALIADLSTDLAPVHRRSVAREAALLAAIGAGELALFLGMGLMRPDMAQAIGTPWLSWKLASLALLAAIGCTTAIRSLNPAISPRRGLRVMLAATGAVLIAGALVDPGSAGQAPLAERVAPLHGMACAVAIIVLSLPMAAAMAVLMRRAAPTNPQASALAIGLAAGSWGAFVFAFCCPANDPLYVALWYLAGCAVVAVIARRLLPRGFRL